jgi:hypothetical protein
MRKLFTLLFALFVCTAAFCKVTPNPEEDSCAASINGKTGEFSMSAAMIIRVGAIKCACKGINVISFDMIITANSATKTMHSENSMMTDAMKKILQRSAKVGYVTLVNVKAVNSKGEIQILKGLSITLD